MTASLHVVADQRANVAALEAEFESASRMSTVAVWGALADPTGVDPTKLHRTFAYVERLRVQLEAARSELATSTRLTVVPDLAPGEPLGGPSA